MATPRDPFRSKRLHYRAIRDPDDNALFAAINDDRIGYMNSNASNATLPTSNDAIKFRDSCAKELLGAVICLPSDEDLTKPGTEIGQIHLKGAPAKFMHHRSTEIGIDILPAWQGWGYGSEAIKWALEYAFLRVGLHKVRIRAFGWNEGAMRLYERLGFKVEGRERESLWHEGKFWDGMEYGMIDREWHEMRQAGY